MAISIRATGVPIATGSTPPGLLLAKDFTVRWMPELETGCEVAFGPVGWGRTVMYTR